MTAIESPCKTDTPSPVNRVLELISDTPPWEYAIEVMGQAVRDHTQEEIQIAITACRDHLYSVMNQQMSDIRNQAIARVNQAVQEAVTIAMKPLQNYIDDVKAMMETLPSLVRASLEGVPNIVVQTPRREVIKNISYDSVGRPIEIHEREISEKKDL